MKQFDDLGLIKTIKFLYIWKREWRHVRIKFHTDVLLDHHFITQ